MSNPVRLKNMLTALADLAMPRRCIVCGEPLTLRERHLCISCLADLPRTFFAGQPRNQMSDRFNALIQQGLEQSGAEGTEPYARAVALFYYRSRTGYREITRRLKYHGDFAVGRYFARMLAAEMAASSWFRSTDAIVPVPLHWTRRWSRGYNQAEIIARELSRSLGVPMRTDILCRVSRTRSQAKLSLEEKARNVSDAFKLRERFLRQIHSGRGRKQVLPRRILLVDDVFTTGATLYSCFRAIRKGFSTPVHIDVATLACVGQ